MRRALRISAWTVGALLSVIVVLGAVVLIGGNTMRDAPSSNAWSTG
jgi:hypothetical protein